jgi:septal ring factor EnvC (AmiA/AmiB activator)
MNNLKIPLTLIFAMVLQFVALVWYVSKIDSRVNLLYENFEAENQKEVIENQIRMKLDLENMVISVNEVTKELKKIKKQMERFTKKTNQISNQIEKFHKKERKGTIIQQSN